MLSCFVGLWVAAVGQVAPDEALLKLVPADVPVVVRGRALESVRDDLAAMLGAMSPALAGPAKEALDGALPMAEGLLGDAVLKGPFLLLARLPDLAAPAPPDWGVIVPAADPGAVVKGLIQDGEAAKALAGYDSFPSKAGATWYAAKGAGWAAFGPDEATIRAIGKPGAGLAANSPELRAKLLAGDLGVYVNVAGIQKQYGAAFEEFKPQFLAMVQQQQADAAPGARAVEGAKAMADGLSALLRVGDGLALSLDSDAAALTLSGLATVRPGTPAAKSLASATTGTAALFDRLPADAMAYLFLNTAADSGPIPGGSIPRPKPSAAEDKAVAARMKALEGRQVMAIATFPLRVVSLADPEDPGAAVKASLEANEARREAKEGEITIEPGALSHGGFRFDHVRVKFDDKMLAQLKATRPDVPNLQAMIDRVLPGGVIHDYTGTDGKLFLTAMAPGDDQVKALVDSIQGGNGNLGNLPAWKALRAKLPKEVSVLVALNAQEVVKLVLGGLGAMDGNDYKVPADLPKAAALMGFALMSSPTGYDFRLVVPSEVGPVLERGLAPLAEGQ